MGLTLFFDLSLSKRSRSRKGAPYSFGELHVLIHDGDPVGVGGQEHGVLKQLGQVVLGRLLQAPEHRKLLLKLVGFWLLLVGLSQTQLKIAIHNQIS